MAKKKTHEAFLSQLNEINKNIKVRGRYTRALDKIECECLVCNYIWYPTPDKLLRGRGCPKCAGNKKKTNEEFLEELFKVNPDIVPLEKYINSNTWIKVVNKKCGHTYLTSPICLLRGYGCPTCNAGSGMRKTDEYHKEKILKNNKNVEVVNLFSKNGRKYAECKCLMCGELFKKRTDELFNGKPCPKCAKRKSSDEFETDLYLNPYNKNISILTKYSASRDNMKFQCDICDYVWETLPRNMTRGLGCPNCNGYAKRTHSQFLDEVSKFNNKFEYLTEYDGVDKYIKCKCKNCGTITPIRASHLLEGSGCPVCNISKGEKRISFYLSKNNIKFKSHKKYKNLLGTGGGKLSYDFYLPSHNLLIEFQGKQHEEAFDYFGGEERFEKQQEHDKRKREYAHSNSINLLEIWYYDFDNIEEILTKALDINTL